MEYIETVLGALRCAGQVVLIDTPGIHRHENSLGGKMMVEVRQAEKMGRFRQARAEHGAPLGNSSVPADKQD